MLKVSGLNVFYGDLPALSELAFEVHAGEIVSILGSNGAGKSTTLHTISGLIRPKRGQIIFEDQNITQASTWKIVELGLCHVPEGRQIFPTMTVLENLEMGAQSAANRKNSAQNIEQVLAYFPKLKERLDQKAGTLSGGEQQMLAIGRGLMSGPKLLMLDEPSLGLSPLLVETIFEIIKEINRHGASILLVEQNVYHALRLAHRAYVLENGRIALSGLGADLIENPHIRQTYLGL